jgi:hypothetical protein
MGFEHDRNPLPRRRLAKRAPVIWAVQLAMMKRTLPGDPIDAGAARRAVDRSKNPNPQSPN